MSPRRAIARRPIVPRPRAVRAILSFVAMPRPRSRLLALPLALLPVVMGTCRHHHGANRAHEPDRELAEAAAALRGWHYQLTLDPSLARADVRLCFEGRPPPLLVPGTAAAAPHAHDVRRLDGEPLPRQGSGHALATLGDDACLEYAVDLPALERDDDTDRLVGRTGDSLLVRPGAWLWQPDPRPASADVTVRFSLPEGMEVSVPWPAREGEPRGTDRTTYVLDATAFEWLGHVVLGDVTVDRFERAGTEVELVTLDAELACPPEGLRAWAVDAIDTVALLYDGRFPRDRLQLVVIPVEGGGGGTVYFGLAGRGGGAGVMVFLDDHAQAEALPGGWTTVHELLHHGMPFVREAWMAEGWVSYYTEIMRTRAGHRSEREGWQALLEAFERGRRGGAGMTLAQTSEKMHETHAYQRVYWGGAAVALLADVELRLRTHGAVGLDDAIKELRRCCGDAEHTWSAQALLEHLDAWHGRPLFTEIAQQVLHQDGFPDVEAAMARLGVRTTPGGEVRLDDDHPAAAFRRAIMAPRPSPAAP